MLSETQYICFCQPETTNPVHPAQSELPCKAHAPAADSYHFRMIRVSYDHNIGRLPCSLSLRSGEFSEQKDRLHPHRKVRIPPDGHKPFFPTPCERITTVLPSGSLLRSSSDATLTPFFSRSFTTSSL